MSIRTRRWVTADGKPHEALIADVKVSVDGIVRRARVTLPNLNRTDGRNAEKVIRGALLTGAPVPSFESSEALREQQVVVERTAKHIPTLATFEKKFIEDYAMVKNKPSEIHTKKFILKKHLVPFFGDLRLDVIDEEHIDSYIAKKTRAGLAPKTINNHMAVLAKMLVVAKRWKLIETVPDIEWQIVRDQPYDFLTFEEATKLISGMKEEPWRTMMIVAMKTGLRPSELRALRWQDVDFKGQKLNVRLGEYNGHVSTPKDDDSREVALSPEALELLRKHPHHLRSLLVFCNSEGVNMKDHAMRNALARVVAKAKFPRELSWYVFRHTFASHLVMRGVSLKAVGELMGHSTMDMTMRYAHLSPEIKQDAVRLLDGMGTAQSRASDGVAVSVAGPTAG